MTMTMTMAMAMVMTLELLEVFHGVLKTVTARTSSSGFSCGVFNTAPVQPWKNSRKMRSLRQFLGKEKKPPPPPPTTTTTTTTTTTLQTNTFNKQHIIHRRLSWNERVFLNRFLSA
uniref:Secreted protein n=1 Tax=Glossina austeni TaxID=7395 RepID=A0A1A9VIL6_GLOAU